MNSRFVGILLFIIVLACIITGVIVYPQLPAIFVSHWNAAGQANGTISNFWGVCILPIIMLLLIGLWALLPRVDPIDPGFKGFRKAYDFLMLLIVAFLAYVYALILLANLGLQSQILPMILPALALLMFVLGALLPCLKRNWFVGIRTPWTISNDIVWDKTHKLGSWLIEIASLFILAAAFAPRTVSLWLLVVSILGAALISVVYSYFVFRDQKA